MNAEGQRVSFGELHAKRKDETHELVLYWFGFAFLIGIISFVFGLFIGFGETVQEIARGSKTILASLGLMSVIVSVFAVYVARKTLRLALQ